MITKRHIVLFFAISFFCHTGWPAEQAEENQNQKQLELCNSFYRNGEYLKTADTLTALLPLLSTWDDSLYALEYLGYSLGMLGRIDQAKTYFKIILEKLPGLEIDTLESPPNITVIFKQAKLELKIAALDSIKSLQQEVTPARKRSVFPVIMLSGAIISAGTAGYFYYSGTVLQEKYRSINTPDQAVLDKSYNDYRNAYLISAAAAGISAVLLPSSIYFILRKDPLSGAQAVTQLKGTIFLAYSF